MCVAGVNGSRRVGQNVTRSDLHERVVCACAMEIALVHLLTTVASERVLGLSWSRNRNDIQMSRTTSTRLFRSRAGVTAPPRRAEGRLRPWPRGTVCRRACSLCRGRCSTSTPWLRPTSERSSGSSPFAGSAAPEAADNCHRAGGDGLRRAPLEQGEAGGDFFRRCKTVAQGAPLCALACNMLVLGAALECRCGLRKESLGRGASAWSWFLVSASHNVRYYNRSRRSRTPAGSQTAGGHCTLRS